MTDYEERRNYPRITVEGANIAYKVRQSFDLFNRYSSFQPMRDLAKGGVSFELDSKVTKGATVELRLNIPDEKRIPVKGIVVWTNNITNNGRVFAGVQFLPFGKGRMYNSFECWDKLEQIIRVHYDTKDLN